ncbi:MAG TPA: hypothetical protein VND98_05685, partial [Solirubrobacterales bacterium]|nr:hypothetical protein [Solirubrobacterales bacterium]
GGETRGVVVATAMHTELGRIAALSERVKEEPSPLERQVRRVAWLIAGFALSAPLTAATSRSPVGVTAREGGGHPNPDDILRGRFAAGECCTLRQVYRTLITTACAAPCPAACQRSWRSDRRSNRTLARCHLLAGRRNRSRPRADR